MDNIIGINFFVGPACVEGTGVRAPTSNFAEEMFKVLELFAFALRIRIRLLVAAVVNVLYHEVRDGDKLKINSDRIIRVILNNNRNYILFPGNIIEMFGIRQLQHHRAIYIPYTRSQIVA